ncbi:TPA: DNA cytosine methyltransferase [Klebsiella pneumoniae]|uniref:DNA cytosine methyltransferase n=1 Tax=Klebsiella pneumoniae TaxID=573 RepID=UPI002847A5C8|nr:DNA cytosine methyltransferase [Klebsiella pneumoniae]MDR4672938.1 DNA cytosine methyltransferase [Klebsiella pneumoniae]MDX6799158.1 DNA cytosine methyltransferase [Klebsiella pneumoniae]HBQ8474609.1 DNA cytosine methyltransferase [Klebsiella pneumoniae]HBQ8527159.1 DNA cytosine methyltransferase [Klebsiella pneumoniae]HBQ8564011.1 DNA cytosine methyltransferase [Klebsiella pneumoniae]
MREIIVDNFAGGGGASTGIEMAIGRSVDIAINHDENAVAMHRTNHPDTLHYCESVFDVSPGAATSGKPVGLTWFSPDCRHFSKAKGAKPVEKAIRGLAWIVLRWALDVGPRVMMLENVEEFKTWGPLLAAEMRPDPDRVGETFEAFVGMLTSGVPADHPALLECCEFLELSPDSEQAMRLITGLGYDVDYRELRACDYGAPTIRKRFFMVMRRDGQSIVWPAATHGDPKSPAVISGKLAPWRTAAECIDWSIPAPSIFDRKKSLAENTLKRIARGIQRFVIESASPFIVKCNHTTTKGKYDCFRGQAPSEPLQTITKTHGYAIAVPHLTKFRDGQSTDEPMPTITAGGQHVGEVKTTLAVADYDEERAQQVLAFLQQYCGEDSTGLVDIGGVTYRIVDIGMRMLQPHELYRAQGFPEWYIIDRDYRGVKYAKDKQVARCGNAVPPPFAEALVRANLPEMCVNKQERAA